MKKVILLTVILSLFAIGAHAEEPPTIAVLDFKTTVDTDAASQVPALLTDALVNSGRFTIVERSRFGQIVKEQGLTSTGFVDPTTAVSLGEVAGASYLLAGEVIDASKESRVFKGFGTVSKTDIYILRVGVRIIETSTGKAIFSTIKEAEEREYESADLLVDGRTVESVLAQSVAGMIMDEILQDEMFAGMEATEAAALVRVSITSDPPDADIEVDGVFYGNAGGQMKLPEGLHLVKISLPGYEVWDKKVRIVEGTRIKAMLVLENEADVRLEIEKK
jgi:curli biogenesis system outer membrane secretion channel CsgG